MNKDTKIDLIKEAIDIYRQEEIKNKKKTVYHNTELLMKHYNELKLHAENAVYEVNQIFQNGNDYDTEDYCNDDRFYVGSILKSKVRTAIMIQHIDMALEMLKDNAIQNIYEDKYNAFVDIYIQNIPYSELSIKHNCAERTIRRWKNEMINKLSFYLFGKEGLIFRD